MRLYSRIGWCGKRNRSRISRKNGRNACCNTTSTIHIANFTNGLWNDATPHVVILQILETSREHKHTHSNKRKKIERIETIMLSISYERWCKRAKEMAILNVPTAFRIKRLMRIMYHLNAANRIPNIIFHSVFIDVMRCVNVCPVPHINHWWWIHSFMSLANGHYRLFTLQ